MAIFLEIELIAAYQNNCVERESKLKHDDDDEKFIIARAPVATATNWKRKF